MKCQILLSRKNKKNIINLSSVELAVSVVKVKADCAIVLDKMLFKTKHIGIFFPYLSMKVYVMSYVLSTHWNPLVEVI